MDEGRGSLGEVILRCSDSKLGESDRTGVCTGELSCEDWSGDAGVSTRFVDSEPKSLPRTPIFFFLFSIIKRRMEYYKGCWRVVTATRFLYLLFYSRFLIRKITMTGFSQVRWPSLPLPSYDFTGKKCGCETWRRTQRLGCGLPTANVVFAWGFALKDIWGLLVKVLTRLRNWENPVWSWHWTLPGKGARLFTCQ